MDIDRIDMEYQAAKPIFNDGDARWPQWRDRGKAEAFHQALCSAFPVPPGCIVVVQGHHSGGVTLYLRRGSPRDYREYVHVFRGPEDVEIAVQEMRRRLAKWESFDQGRFGTMTIKQIDHARAVPSMSQPCMIGSNRPRRRHMSSRR